MKATVTTHDRRVEIREVDRPTPGAGQLVLKVEASGICGTDLHLLEALGAGVTLGHEFTGSVSARGDGVEGFEVGDRVVALPAISCKTCVACLSGDPINCPSARYIGGTADGAFAEYILVDAQASLRVPDEVSTDAAGIVEPLAVTLKIFEKAAARPGDRLLVLGAGPVGLGVTLWARASGVASIIVSDPVASRRDLASQLGATAVVDPTTADLTEFCDDRLGAAPEIVVECVGRPGLFEQATRVVAPEGRIVVAGMHLGQEGFKQQTPFLKNLTVVFSSWYAVRHFRHAVDMLAAQRIDPMAMITHRIGLEDLDRTLEALRTPNEYGKVLVHAS